MEVLEYPSLQTLQTLVAHTAGCYCIAIDPTEGLSCSLNHLPCLTPKCLTRKGAVFWARYLVVGSADALVTVWNVHML